ncbi:UNVERIFIED_CONTAM: hypothetical protein FKN15_026275 [Acipenser sinensis]
MVAAKGSTTTDKTDIKELITRINKHMEEQEESNHRHPEEIERRRRELGLDPLEIKEWEPTQLELLLQKWNPAGKALLSPPPKGEALLSPPPEGEALLSLAPEEVKPVLSPEPEEEPLPFPEPWATIEEEVKSALPPQLKPPTLRAPPAPESSDPCPKLRDTLPKVPDLPLLGLLPRSVLHQAVPRLVPHCAPPASPDVVTQMAYIAWAPPPCCCVPPGGSEVATLVPILRPLPPTRSPVGAPVAPVTTVGSLLGSAYK